MYLFGITNSYSLYTYNDGEPLNTIPNQTVTAHIFTSMPSREDALAGTGALIPISHSHVSSSVITFDIPAIDDPDQNSLTQYYDYYIAIKFVLEASEQTQLVLRRIRYHRIIGKDQTPGVTKEKIQSLFPEIYKFISESELQAIIDMAEMGVKHDLKLQGYEWALINEPSQLYNVLLQRVLRAVYASQVMRQGDRFNYLYEIAKGDYQNAIDSLRLQIGAEDSSGVAVSSTPSMRTISVSR